MLIAQQFLMDGVIIKKQDSQMLLNIDECMN